MDEGDLDLQSLLNERPLVKNRRRWINVYQQIRNHVMPPADEKGPTASERRTLVAWIHNEIFNFDYSAINDPGHEPTRRLTHQEYANTVRDLLRLELDVLTKFPADLSASSGFDNSANTLFVQPLLMEKYFQIAEFISDKVALRHQERPVSNPPFLRFFPDDKMSPENAFAKNLKQFLPRAFRRSVAESEIRSYQSIFSKAYLKSGNFVDASRKTLQAILVSPNFIFRLESSTTAEKALPVSDYEMASRLSYFLWSSMPDDELLQAAKNKELTTDAGLRRQVTRMLADPKSKTLGTIFGSQWMGYQHLGTRIRADPIDNPWCTDSLMDAMKSESAMLLNDLILENQPVNQLLDSRHTFVNEELAKFYGIKGILGKKMRKVPSPSGRQGILGHASILAVTSHPYQTSPVKRGTWVLTELLGTPPPPPPPGASDFDEKISENDRLSFRQKLARHSSNSSCATCHSQIDPLGFGLERFDWFGRKRHRRVDNSGQLPDGTRFRGLIEMNEALIKNRSEDIARNYTKRLLAFALSRQLEYYDEKTVNQILKKTKPKQYPMRDILMEVIQSYPFRYKKQPLAK